MHQQNHKHPLRNQNHPQSQLEDISSGPESDVRRIQDSAGDGAPSHRQSNRTARRSGELLHCDGISEWRRPLQLHFERKEVLREESRSHSEADSARCQLHASPKHCAQGLEAGEYARIDGGRW